MHGHGSARAEILCSDVFWGEAKSGCSHSQVLGSNDGNDAGCADGAEAIIGGIISDGVVVPHPWSLRRSNMLMPALTG